MPLHIGFEGPIGAGKTTLAQLFGAHLNANVLLEDVDGNEFLADFYCEPPRWSLPMQLWFLSVRHEQLSEAISIDDRVLVADYTYAKDAVFARLLLKDRELRLYNRIAASLNAKIAKPDLIVYLDAVDDVLLERIKGRGRPYESEIKTSYLDSVRQVYERHLLPNAGMKVFRYDTSRLDLSSESHMQVLYQAILASAS
jgi:deoxyguanosine kinase